MKTSEFSCGFRLVLFEFFIAKMEPVVEILSPKVKYDTEFITSEYEYTTQAVHANSVKMITSVIPKTIRYTFRTKRHIPKVGYVFYKLKIVCLALVSLFAHLNFYCLSQFTKQIAAFFCLQIINKMLENYIY